LLFNVPTKIWRSEPVNIWTGPTYANDINDDLLIGKEYGPVLARTQFGQDFPPRDDIVLWNDSFQAELDAGLRLGTDCPPEIRTRIVATIKENRDCFL
jgi:hypothetical protein